VPQSATHPPGRAKAPFFSAPCSRLAFRREPRQACRSLQQQRCRRRVCRTATVIVGSSNAYLLSCRCRATRSTPSAGLRAMARPASRSST
jgi:hypothetical protein